MTLSDEGISGLDARKRDEFNRMLADCRAGKIDRILVKSVSRFARNTRDTLRFISCKFHHNGTSLQKLGRKYYKKVNPK